MSRSVALLRGVGGPTALRMPDLRAALRDAGLGEVETLQVAGNVVFAPDGRAPDASADLVRRTVREAFGHDLPVVVRSHAELVDAERRNPFLGTQEGRWVATLFLDRAPADPDGLDPDAGAPDRFAVDGTEAFVRYTAGVGRSRLQAAWFERRLGVVGTARNANTVARLVTLTA